MVNLFTPQNSALLLIDHQVGTMQLIKTIESDRAKQMAIVLTKAAREHARRAAADPVAVQRSAAADCPYPVHPGRKGQGAGPRGMTVETPCAGRWAPPGTGQEQQRDGSDAGS